MDGLSNFGKRLKPILGFWKKLNEVFIQSNFEINLFSHKITRLQGTSLVHLNDMPLEQNDNITDPWNSFIFSELIMAKKLIKIIHQTLIVMHGAMRDITSLTKEDFALMMVICENQVPLKWRQVWSGPKLIIDYMKAVVNRSIEAEKRHQSSNHLTFCDEIDFAKVFNVESFFATLKLKNAR